MLLEFGRSSGLRIKIACKTNNDKRRHGCGSLGHCITFMLRVEGSHRVYSTNWHLHPMCTSYNTSFC